MIQMHLAENSFLKRFLLTYSDHLLVDLEKIANKLAISFICSYFSFYFTISIS